MFVGYIHLNCISKSVFAAECGVGGHRRRLGKCRLIINVARCRRRISWPDSTRIDKTLETANGRSGLLGEVEDQGLGLKPLQITSLGLSRKMGRAYATVQTHQHVFKVPCETEDLYSTRKLNFLRRENIFDTRWKIPWPRYAPRSIAVWSKKKTTNLGFESPSFR